MGFPVIGYHSIFHAVGATYTASSTESGFDVLDLGDYKSYKIWKAGSLTSPQYIDIASGTVPDYIALINHNLDSLSAVVNLYGDEVFNPPTTLRYSFTPVGEVSSFRTFTITPGTYNYWRVEFKLAFGSFAEKPYVGELFLGYKMQLPEYLSPVLDPYFTQVEVTGNRSEGGHYLASILRGQKHRGIISPGGPAGLAGSYWTSTLHPFIRDHASKRLPFVFVVDPNDGRFSRALYLKVPDDADIRRQAVGGTWNRFALDMPVEEAWMEPA